MTLSFYHLILLLEEKESKFMLTVSLEVMECNSDEAIRAKIIAEKKFEDRDFSGAKQFALKAQNLYPQLEGLTQMLITLDIYIAAQNRVSGEVDWYGVLGVNPSTDYDTMRKQYRKLALMLHPDKNKSVGADGAFKFLSQAWSLLSDKGKRLAYNQRRIAKGFQPKVQSQPQKPYMASTSNVYSKVHLKPMAHKNTVPAPSFQRTDTFWTICYKCKMHYEYQKLYLNHMLLCPNCYKSFQAVEIVPPVKMSVPSYSSFLSTQKNQVPSSNPGRNTAATQNISQGGFAAPNSLKHTTSSWGSDSNVAGPGKTEPLVAAKASGIFRQANGTLKREHEESPAFALKGEASSKRRVLDGNDHHYGGKLPFQMSMGNNGSSKGSIYEHGFAGSNRRPKSTRELTHLENRSMLMKKATMEIRKKLTEWKLEAVNMAAEKKKVEESGEEERKIAMKCGAQSSGVAKPSTTKKADGTLKNLCSTSGDVGKTEDPAPLSMNVPDPDFHDFDQDRTETSFEDNQIWAAYDDDDGMPRYYAFIQKVISKKPFKMRISWLTSKTNSEFSSMEWVASGFYKTCGEFRIGKYEIYKSLNSLSHKVKWKKGARGILQIVPQKGDIWALYRNWSDNWNELTPDEVIHKYDMVEVLDDYNEESGVSVTPLVKVEGFRTVFRPHPEHSRVLRIPKEEMFRFSHQVPNYMLTGQEAQNAPKGCQELDPAATPLELLNAINEVSEVPAGGKPFE